MDAPLPRLCRRCFSREERSWQSSRILGCRKMESWRNQMKKTLSPHLSIVGDLCPVYEFSGSPILTSILTQGRSIGLTLLENRLHAFHCSLTVLCLLCDWSCCLSCGHRPSFTEKPIKKAEASAGWLIRQKREGSDSVDKGTRVECLWHLQRIEKLSMKAKDR